MKEKKCGWVMTSWMKGMGEGKEIKLPYPTFPYHTGLYIGRGILDLHGPPWI